MKNICKIAFTGKMGAGKSTATLSSLGLFTEKYGFDDTKGFIIAFANPLHQCAMAFHCKEKPRKFLQRVGDVAREEFGDDIIEKIFQENVENLINKRIPGMPEGNVLIMVDDLRFLNEYKLVKELGFTVIRVETDEEVRKKRLGNLFTNVKHRSETEMELFAPDFVIQNNDEDPEYINLESQLKQLFLENDII